MNLLPFKPYETTENILTNLVTLRVSKEDFKNVVFKDGHSIISFSFCAFNHLVIENPEEISFPDISIVFISCFIGKLEVGQIASSNVSVSLISCILDYTKLENPLLKSVLLQNNIIREGVFLIGLSKIEIRFASKSLHLRRWLELFRMIKFTNYRKLTEHPQAYYVYNASTVIYETDDSNLKGTMGFIFKLHLSFGLAKPDSMTRVTNGYFSSLSISGEASGKLTVDNLSVDNLYFHNFSASQEATFYNVRSVNSDGRLTKLEINQCKLDNVWFDNVDFDQFGRIALYRSRLSKTTFTGCTFPSSYSTYIAIANVHYPGDRQDGYHKDQYEMFLQLKNALEGTGNAYEAHKFQALSLQALAQSKGLSRQDRILIGMNELSNRHGLSILRPILWFIGTSTVLYVLYLWSLGRAFTTGKFDPLLVGYYFSFLDITHRNDFLVSRNEFTPVSLGIDYSGKIVIGYLVYQFIAAFRKYSRKPQG
jgi:hypothetical protein